MVDSQCQAYSIRPNESAWHDLLRILLIAQVVLGHLAAIAIPSIPELLASTPPRTPEIVYRLFTRFGPQAAYLFVFLSGFMVAGGLLIAIKSNTLPSANAFFRSRMSRILPISFFAILMTGALDLQALGSLGKSYVYQSAYSYDMTSTFTWKAFIGNLLFLQPVAVPAFGSNGPLWTLGYLVQFYILGWLIARLSIVSPSFSALAICGVLAIMFAVKPEWSILFASWIFGGAARLLKAKHRYTLAFGIFSVLLFIGSNLAPPLVSALLSIPVGVLFVLFARSAATPIPDHFRHRLRVFASESFSIYASHHPVAMFVFALVLAEKAKTMASFAVYLVAALLSVGLASFILSRLATLAIVALPQSNRTSTS